MKKRHPFWATLGVIFLVFIIAGGVTALCGYFLGWYDKATDTEESDLESGTRDDLDPSESIIIPYKIPEEDYEEYGISTYGEVISAYNLTADLAGTYYDPRIDWKIEWDTSYTGNDSVQDYVSLTYESNVIWTATLVCLKPFAYNIYVTAYRTVYPDIYATCKLDYVADAEATVSASFNEETKSIDVGINPNIGVGTIVGEFSFADDLKIVADEETISCIADLLSDNFPSYLYELAYTELSGFDTSYYYLAACFDDICQYYRFNFVYSDNQLINLDFSSFIKALCYDVCYLSEIQELFDFGYGSSYGSETAPVFYCTLEDYFELYRGSLPAFYRTQLCFSENVWADPTDLYYVFSQTDWDFAVTGTVLYTSSLGVTEIPFETRVTVTGGSFEITGDNANISLSDSNIIF